MERTLHRWKVQLQSSRGELVERDFDCFWDPQKVESSEIASACAAITTVAEGGAVVEGRRAVQFAGLSAVYQNA